jgi:starch-binding outer membrane protein, SusD/RagB family
MKRLTYILSLTLLLGSITSCNDDFLNTTPLDKLSEAGVWNDPALIQAFVNNIYFGIPHGHTNQMMASLTDESMYNADFGASNVTKSLVTPSDYYTWDMDWTAQGYRKYTWDVIYKFLRATNVFMDKIEDAPFLPEEEDWRQRLIGEVHFLRAYLYHNLVSMYGGVPILTSAFTLSDDFELPRNTYKESIDFIVSELDKAAELLPLAHNTDNKGRANKGAALALKSRVLLHAASELYHNTSWAGNYSNPELISYQGDRNALYQAAKDAAKAVMDLGVYSMYKPNPASPEEATQNYGEIFLLKETSEDIYVRFFSEKTEEDWDGYNPGLYNNPNGYHGWGSNTPAGQLVDDYEMLDGSRFSWNNPAHASDPYVNRDPRFYATILYNGAKWRQRPSDVIASDPVGIIQTGFWHRWDAARNEMVEIPGLDTRKSPIEDWNGTYTAYYMRKFVDPTIDAQYFKQDLPWRFIRYTEIVLNYAEAALGLGQEEEARTYINMVRKRAGMPEIPASVTGQELVERYRNERRIELAYEDHRYFDVRRWMIAPQTYGHVQGVEIIYPLLPDKTTATKPTFKVINVQDRAWLNRAYFLPIKLTEMNRNRNLIQNPLFN